MSAHSLPSPLSSTPAARPIEIRIPRPKLPTLSQMTPGLALAIGALTAILAGAVLRHYLAEGGVAKATLAKLEVRSDADGVVFVNGTGEALENATVRLETVSGADYVTHVERIDPALRTRLRWSRFVSESGQLYDPAVDAPSKVELDAGKFDVARAISAPSIPAALPAAAAPLPAPIEPEPVAPVAEEPSAIDIHNRILLQQAALAAQQPPTSLSPEEWIPAPNGPRIVAERDSKGKVTLRTAEPEETVASATAGTVGRRTAPKIDAVSVTAPREEPAGAVVYIDGGPNPAGGAASEPADASAAEGGAQPN